MVTSNVETGLRPFAGKTALVNFRLGMTVGSTRTGPPVESAYRRTYRMIRPLA